MKDSFNRECPASPDITTVKVDLRRDTHDVIQVFMRGQPCGQLVTDKNDSVTVARRLLPESLKYGKEPSTIVRNMEQLGEAYAQLLMEVRSAIGHGSVTPLALYLRKLDANMDSGARLPGDGHLFVPDRLVRAQGKDTEHSETHGTSHPNLEA